MTVKTVNETQGKISACDVQKSNEFQSPELSMKSGKLDGINDGEKLNGLRVVEKSKVCGEVETDQESGGSEEEFESPKSVAKVGRWRKRVACVHSQVARIREEDSHLGEDIGEGLSAKDKIASGHHVASPMDFVLFSRPILPSSPLSGKTPVRRLH
ncbi:hypothetical protein L1049_003276 [Liquidambar formosana]|uniref:Uncharacterized protein n=1 Tax=Liquidambar formosana TaxID=63359 RepID=A0AAP0NGG0_LIQFO